MIVEIKGETLKFEFNSIWGVGYDFETLTQFTRPFELRNTLDLHIAMYGVLMRCNPGLALNFETFVEELNNLVLAKAMTEYFINRMKTLDVSEKIKIAIEEGEKTTGNGQRTGDEIAGNGEQAGNGDPDSLKKKDGTQRTRCIRPFAGIMGWIRRIFSGR